MELPHKTSSPQPPKEQGATQPRIQSTWIILAAMGLVALFAKVIANQDTEFLGYDGSYYANVAKNVRDGIGLKSDVSMFHQGLPYFPHPTPIYPLWPLLLGYAAWILDLTVAAVWLPTLLYFMTLAGAWLLVQRLKLSPIALGTWKIPAPLLAVLFVGANPHFFACTSVPYTEGLAFFGVVLFLHAGLSYTQKPGFGLAVLIGCLSAMTFLTRAQLLVVFAATMVWFAMLFFGSWQRRILVHGGGAALGFGLCLWPQYAHLKSFMAKVGLHEFLRYDQYQATTYLEPLPVLVKQSSLLEFFLDKLPGFLIAFNYNSYHSYFQSFGWHFLFLPVAALLLVFGSFNKAQLAKWQALVLGRRSPFYLLLLLLGCAGFFSLHMIHKNLYVTWNFGIRHALAAAILFLMALYFAFLQPNRWIRIGAAVLFCLGLYSNIDLAQDKLAMLKPRVNAKNSELIGWINDESKSRPDGLIMVIPKPTPLEIALQTQGTGFHWVYERTSLAELDALFSRLNADYLVIHERDYKFGRFRFLKRRDDFLRRFTRQDIFIRNYWIFTHSGRSDQVGVQADQDIKPL